MKYGIKVLSLLLMLVVSFQGAGCSSLFGPSDEEVIKAINDSGILKSSNFTVAAPIEVLEKMRQGNDGSWLVKIKLTLTMTVKGEPSTRVTTPLFRVHKSKDSGGKTVWTATIGP